MADEDYEDEDYETCDEDEEDYEEESMYDDGDITESGKPFLKLIGTDGNALSVIGRAMRAARTAKWSQEKIDEYRKKAMSGDYNNVLATTMEYFDVE
jgi:hypothetical protein